MPDFFVTWLVEGGVGPAVAALPVNFAANKLAGAARAWFRRLHRTDDLSRLLRVATGTSFDLTDAEFDAARQLLEEQQTWTLLGRGTVEDLADRVASCLPAHADRSAERSHDAAMAIARGLLEFAVADLDPKLFQQVLLTRLQRMATNQATVLDEALLGMHADLSVGFASVIEHLNQVMDRLPPGPAHRLEIVKYLRTLIDWLNSDPWPQDPQFGGPLLTPAAIERKLRVTAADRPSKQDLGADELAQQCHRLVILGGPGSGKTWLAKRAARRCAEDALKALAAGQSLHEVELPLYTTCSRLFGADGDLDIREAIVSSALSQIGDLGGSRISAALRAFFTERSAPTLLIIDSLDEAHGSHERLRLADTLPWRIILTSRPSSWKDELHTNDDDSRRVGELQPLRYPSDVEFFIHSWFAGRPEWGRALAAQIRRRPSLQQAASVPLILSFCCIIGGHEALPEFRHDLYARVLKRILTGRWRSDENRQPDAGACLQRLRTWASSGAASHPVSDVGMWTDDIRTEFARLNEADKDAVDHVATPLGPPDIDTLQTLRRFIHRSVREHLVAEYVASLPVDQAAETLLPHLWYDPDWEYVVPAALVMHDQRDRLLRGLICRAANSDEFPANFFIVDGAWEFRGLLARVACESTEADWSPEIAEMISQARVELALSARTSDLAGAVHWHTSNREAREGVLGLLAQETNKGEARQLVETVALLAPTAEDEREAREGLLELLANQTDSDLALDLMSVVALLDPTAGDERTARESLLKVLAHQTDGTRASMLVNEFLRLGPTPEEKRQALQALLGLLASQTDRWVADYLVDGVVRLIPSPKVKHQTRATLLKLLVRQTDAQMTAKLAGGVARLDPTEDEKRQTRETLLGLLIGQADGYQAAELADGLAQLDPVAGEKRQGRKELLKILAREGNLYAAQDLADAVVLLAPTAEDKCKTREALLGVLTQETYNRPAPKIVGALVELDPTAEDMRQARKAMLKLLAREKTDSWEAARLVAGLVQLDPTAEDMRQARETLLGRLACETIGTLATEWTDGLAQLDPTAEDKRQAREALLRLLACRPDHPEVAKNLASELAQLDPTSEDKRQAREALLKLMQDDLFPETWLAGVIRLSSTAEDKRQAREALLGLLIGQADGYQADELANGLAELDPTAEDKRQAREALLGLLARRAMDSPSHRRSRPWLADDALPTYDLAGSLAQLDPTVEDKRHTREALLSVLIRQTRDIMAADLAGQMIKLDPTTEDRRQAREALLSRAFIQDAYGHFTANDMSMVAQLDPTVRDLSNWPAWTIQPSAELLAAVRRNTALHAWLAALPSLADLSG